jgi:hypothetical protein
MSCPSGAIGGDPTDDGSSLSWSDVLGAVTAAGTAASAAATVYNQVNSPVKTVLPAGYSLNPQTGVATYSPFNSSGIWLIALAVVALLVLDPGIAKDL